MQRHYHLAFADDALDTEWCFLFTQLSPLLENEDLESCVTLPLASCMVPNSHSERLTTCLEHELTF